MFQTDSMIAVIASPKPNICHFSCVNMMANYNLVTTTNKYPKTLDLILAKKTQTKFRCFFNVHKNMISAVLAHPFLISLQTDDCQMFPFYLLLPNILIKLSQFSFLHGCASDSFL